MLLGALAVYLWIAGLSLNHAYAAADACQPASSATCQGLDGALDGMDNFLSNGFVLQVLPAAIGAFVGAPVLARELETGTFRYTWTQGFGRRRWAVGKLVLLAVVVTAAAGAFGALLTWYYQPFVGNQSLGLPRTTPLTPGLFDLRGIGFPAWTLAAFAIGALAGMLIRRVVPAIVATLVVYTGLAFVTAGFLRQHYLTPLLASNGNSVPDNAWVISQWWSKDGRFAFGSYPPGSILNQFCAPPPASGGKAGAPEGWGPCLVQHGYTSGPATSRPAGSGPSSGSRAAGCSRCRCCSSPPRSGWSNAAPPDGRGVRSEAKQRSVRDKDFQIIFSNGRVVPRLGHGRDQGAAAIRRQPERAAEYGDGLSRRGQPEPPVRAVAADRVEPEDPAVAPGPEEQRQADRRERAQHEPPVVQPDLRRAPGHRLHLDPGDDAMPGAEVVDGGQQVPFVPRHRAALEAAPLPCSHRLHGSLPSCASAAAHAGLRD